MEEKCGCYSKVFVETNAEKIETFRVEVIYCHLHAAAPLMMEALRELPGYLYYDNRVKGYQIDPKSAEEMIIKIYAAIAAASPRISKSDDSYQAEKKEG